MKGITTVTTNKKGVYDIDDDGRSLIGDTPDFNDDGDDEELFICGICEVDLSQMDEHWNLRCGGGLRCSECYGRHLKDCVSCWDEWSDRVCDPATHTDGEGDTATLILPGLCHAIAEQSEAAAVQCGEDLAGELLRPLGDTSKAAGHLESHSPLFRGSTADPQLSLF